MKGFITIFLMVAVIGLTSYCEESLFEPLRQVETPTPTVIIISNPASCEETSVPQINLSIKDLDNGTYEYNEQNEIELGAATEYTFSLDFPHYDLYPSEDCLDLQFALNGDYETILATDLIDPAPLEMGNNHYVFTFDTTEKTSGLWKLRLCQNGNKCSQEILVQFLEL